MRKMREIEREMRDERGEERIFSRNLTKVSELKKIFVGEVLGRH